MKILKSWGNFPYKPQKSIEIQTHNEITTNLKSLVLKKRSTLAYGNGRSYGDSCLASSSNVIKMTGLKKIIDFDRNKGVIKVEPGITIEEILAITVPVGWFLATTPGTKYATIGGAIANDVHGKNHHSKGSFGCYVLRMGLIRSDSGEQICSRSENQDLFQATIGGLGLTGLISWTEIKLTKASSSFINVKTKPFNSLREFFEISKNNDQKHEFCVAWIDCLSNSNRGIYFLGNFSNNKKLKLAQKTKLTIPLMPPFCLINKFSTKIFNTIYFRHHAKERSFETLYQDFFYPLDKIKNWNRIYGKKGFQQYQCLIPKENAEIALTKILKTIRESKSGSFLSVLKNFGSIKSPGLLSFPAEGTTLALDFPQKRNLSNIFDELDKIVVKYQGKIYPAKDAHMSATHFQRFYPNWSRLEELRDRSLNSIFWQRVTKKTN